nr:hypothetical protein [Tanacetum cinerariifolium]
GYIHESSKANHTDETIDHQRAPSTFEEFKRLEEDFKRHEEEMEEMASHGVASQTIEKAIDGFQEAATGNDNVESIKERIKDFKDDGGVGNLDKTTGHK